MTRIALLALLTLLLGAQPALQFHGGNVVLKEEKADNPGPPASVCVEWPEERQCYTSPQGYGRAPQAAVVQISSDLDALLFSAATSGATDYGIHFALLTKGAGRELQDLFFSTIEASNQSWHELWSRPALSSSRIFVLADYVWGPGELTHDPHRYMISTYVRKTTPAFDIAHYYLQDRYMTARKYDPEKRKEILTAERAEIYARLSRIK